MKRTGGQLQIAQANLEQCRREWREWRAEAKRLERVLLALAEQNGPFNENGDHWNVIARRAISRPGPPTAG